MPTFIMKLRDRYCEWSTVVDAPVTNLMLAEDFTAYYQGRYGAHGMRGLPERMARVEATGTSALDGTTNDELIDCNRAGPGECELTPDEIWAKYAKETE